MSKLNLSIGIVSWKSEIIQDTLQSYKDNGLLDLVTDVKILFQDARKKDIQLAHDYNLSYIALENNIGIGKAFLTLAEEATSSSILLLEHDWKLIENKTVTLNRLQSGLELLNKNVDVVRYRHRRYPGSPLFTKVHKGNELNYYCDWHKCHSPHLLDSLHWLDPYVKFPDKIEKEGEYFITTSRWGNWTNNPCIFRKNFYIDTVRDFVGEGIDLEKNIAEFWVNSNFKVAHGEGLFMHNDFIKYPNKNMFKRFSLYLKSLKSHMYK